MNGWMGWMIGMGWKGLVNAAAVAGWAAVAGSGLGCGPTVGIAEDGTGDGGTVAETGSSVDGATGTTPPAGFSTPCDPAFADDESPSAIGVIRGSEGDFVLEFGAYAWGDETFSCDASPPCSAGAGDGQHRTLALVDAVGDLPAVGAYPSDATSLRASERDCGCCNGEGGGPDSWDDTIAFDQARLVVEGVDTQCVHGRWIAYEDEEFPDNPERGRRFVAHWCS